MVANVHMCFITYEALNRQGTSVRITEAGADRANIEPKPLYFRGN